MKCAMLWLVLTSLYVTSRSQGEEDLRLYKACLMECFRCVKTYGKQVYNGKLCAENCAVTNGQSIDTKCYPPNKRSDHGAGTLLSANCARQCHSQCARDYQHNKMDAHSCIFACVLSNERMIAC